MKANWRFFRSPPFGIPLIGFFLFEQKPISGGGFLRGRGLLVAPLARENVWRFLIRLGKYWEDFLENLWYGFYDRPMGKAGFSQIFF